MDKAGGRPFRWLQSLCGLSFMPSPNSSLHDRTKNENPIYKLLHKPGDVAHEKEIIERLVERIEEHFVNSY